MTDQDQLDALAGAREPQTDNGMFLRDGLLALGFEEDGANEQIVAIENEARDAAARERDELRAATEEVCQRWFDYLADDKDEGLRKAMIALRAALHSRDGAS